MQCIIISLSVSFFVVHLVKYFDHKNLRRRRHQSYQLVSDTMGDALDLSVEGQVSCMPIATSAQSQNVFSFYGSDEGIITLEPVISTGMDPANVMTAVSRSALVSHNTYQLVVASVQA